MMTLFRYALRRLMGNKFFFGLLVVIGLYGMQILRGDIIRGVAFTAPFSAWSFGGYLSALQPLLLITMLFFVTFLFSDTEKRVSAITDATPVDQRAYWAVRIGAVLIGYLVIALLAVGMGFVFYARVFSFTAYGTLVAPMLLVLLPSTLFVLGISLLAGRVHQGLLYALMLLMLVAMQLPLPGWMDLLGGSYFRSLPLTLPVGASGEPDFIVTGGMLAGRCVLAAIGIGLVGWFVGRAEGKGFLAKSHGGSLSSNTRPRGKVA